MTEQQGYRYDIFISYSHTGLKWVRDELVSRLERDGLRVCIDYRDFEVGAPSLINMERAVDDSRHTIAVLTPRYIESEWCEFEALLVGTNDPAGRRRKLLPLLLESCSMPKRIAHLTIIDFTQTDAREQQFCRLLNQIRNAAPPPRLPLEERYPFIAGPPIINPRHFFGREKHLKSLFGLLMSSQLQNAVVIGPRRSGKTSLLLFLRNLITTSVTAPEQLRPDQRRDWLPQPERYRWAFVDFQKSHFASQEALLRYFSDHLGLPAPERSDLVSFSNVAKQHLRTPSVILMDEIEVALHRYPELDNEFWEGLRALATTEVGGNLSFVIAATESPAVVARQNGIGSPFFNIFARRVELGPIAESEATALISSSPIPFLPADVEWIIAESGRWPILLQILCYERLLALLDGATDDAWREEGLRQVAPFQHLLTGQ